MLVGPCTWFTSVYLLEPWIWFTSMCLFKCFIHSKRARGADREPLMAFASSPWSSEPGEPQLGACLLACSLRCVVRGGVWRGRCW